MLACYKHIRLFCETREIIHELINFLKLQNVQLNFAATSSMQYPLESASYIFQSSNNNSHNVGQQHQHQHQQQQQQLQQLHLHQQHFSSPVHLHMVNQMIKFRSLLILENKKIEQPHKIETTFSISVTSIWASFL